MYIVLYIILLSKTKTYLPSHMGRVVALVSTFFGATMQCTEDRNKEVFCYLTQSIELYGGLFDEKHFCFLIDRNEIDASTLRNKKNNFRS